MFAVPPPLTADAYLRWEAQQEPRYEYLDGTLRLMGGGTLAHNDLAINLLMLIRPAVRAQGCRVNLADVKVHVIPRNAYFYPDLVVSCHPEDLVAPTAIAQPSLIVEVLSPSTRDYDRGDKFQCYQALASLQEYVLIDGDRVAVEYFRRGEGRMWLYTRYGMGETLTLHSVGMEVDVDAIYDGVRLPPTPNPPESP